MKRLGLLLALTFVLVLAMAGLAYANFGPHGNYVADTDKCAGCHRAHTSPNVIRWMDGSGAPRSALLVTTTTTIRDFCETCHGGNAPGAATDVAYGVLDSFYRPGFPNSASDPNVSSPPGFEPLVTTQPTGKPPVPALNWPSYVSATGQTLSPENYEYNTLSPSNIPFGTLNGGGFYSLGGDPNAGGPGVKATSIHNIQWDGTLVAWGDGPTGTGTTWNSTTNWGIGSSGVSFSCDACHDPHGSSNYRILKDMIVKPNNDDADGIPGGLDLDGNPNDTERIVVGGYGTSFPNNVDPNPDPFVISNEIGYPLAGFRLHTDYPNYEPDYTTARYARATQEGRGISGWCIACHEQYTTKIGTNDLRDNGDGPGFKPGALNPAGPYDAGDGVGSVVRHRHPMNVPLSNFYVGGAEASGPVGDRALAYDPDAWVNIGFSYVDIPLEHDPFSGSDSDPLNYYFYKGDPADTVLDNAVPDGAGSAQRNTISDALGCLTCHRAHGTAATMTRWAVSRYEDWAPFKPVQGNSGTPQAPEWGENLVEEWGVGAWYTDQGPQNPQQGVPPTNDSALLRADNRGVCERCHNK